MAKRTPRTAEITKLLSSITGQAPTPRRRRPVNTRTAVGLVRVSTDQERQELGAEAQRHAIEVWARKEGVTIVAWYTDESSRAANITDRTALLEALAAVGAHGAAYLAVQRLDRFSGQDLSAALALSELARHGASLACADGVGAGDDPAAVMVRGILIAVAGFERAMIAARIKAAMGVKRRRGEFTGEAPFGMRPVPWTAEQLALPREDRPARQLEIDPAEQATIARARELRASGMSIRTIAEELESEGHFNRAGKRFGVAALHALLAVER